MLITLENLGKSWGAEPVLQNINAVVNEGDRIGIIGENGRGKTTLLNILMGILDYDSGSLVFRENATVGYLKQMDGLTLTNTVWEEMQTIYRDVRRAMEELSRIESDSSFEQNPRLLERHRRLENMIYAKDGYNREFLSKKMLSGLGFKEEEWQTPVVVLSGGERTRLNLAKLLLENPDVLILDEPTNHLDFDTLTWLEDYLASYKGAIVAVSHDRFFLDKLAMKIWEIEDTFLTEYKGNYSAFENLKAEKLKVRQRQYEADMEKAAKLKDYIDRNLVRASTTKMAQSRRKQLEKMDIAEKPKPPRVPLNFTFEVGTKPYDEVLTVADLSVGAGGKTLISSLSFTVRSKDRLVIAGANGAGKTTLINTLTGKIKPLSGKIKYGQGAVPVVFDQHVTVSGNTVIDTVWDKRPGWTQLEVRSYLARFGYRGEDVFKSCAGLSGGERARLRFCLISLEKANIMFLDEPTNHLDIYMRRAVTRALAKYEGAVITVTHDRFLMQQLTCPILCIEDGKGVLYRDFDSFLSKHRAKNENPRLRRKKDNSKNAENSLSPQNLKEARRQSAAHRLKLRELEKEIDRLTGLIEGYNSDMADPKITTDPDRMSRLWENMSRAQEALSKAEEEWLSLSETN